MTTEPDVLDISELPELARVADEVRRTGRPCVLRRDGEDVAVVRPARRQPRKGERGWKPTPEQLAATLSTFGAWEGNVDTDALLKNIYADRDASRNRPPLEL